MDNSRLILRTKRQRTMDVVLYTLMITGISICITNSVSFVWLWFDADIGRWDIHAISTLIPILVTPLVTWLAMDATRRLIYLAEENHRLANQDTLTGLPNRRAFMRRAEELQASVGADDVFVCMLGDVDDFKTVNDQYGHLVGDDVLAFIGQQLASLAADNSIVARFGGEEFAIAGVFPSKDAAVSYGETLVRSIERQVFVGHGHKLNITISVGLAEDNGGENLSMLLSRADKALYQAKHEGKNRLALTA